MKWLSHNDRLDDLASLFSQDRHRHGLKVWDMRKQTCGGCASNCFNKITAEEEISLLKHPHFVGGVEGELGQAFVPEHQEATFHGNYLPWKLGHACTVGTWEFPKLIYSVLPPNSPPSSSESVQGWTIFSHFVSWSCAERVLELQRSGPAYSQALESWWTSPHHVNRSQSEPPEELSAAPSPRPQHTTDQHLADGSLQKFQILNQPVMHSVPWMHSCMV